MNQKELVKIAKLEVGQKHLTKKVDGLVEWKEDFMSNHWPHLLVQVEANKVKIAVVTGAAAFLATFIATRILEKL